MIKATSWFVGRISSAAIFLLVLIWRDGSVEVGIKSVHPTAHQVQTMHKGSKERTGADPAFFDTFGHSLCDVPELSRQFGATAIIATPGQVLFDWHSARFLRPMRFPTDRCRLAVLKWASTSPSGRMARSHPLSGPSPIHPLYLMSRFSECGDKRYKRYKRYNG